MRFDAAALMPAAHARWRSMYDACTLPSCQSTIFMRSIQSRVGVTIGERWYCSVDCFVAAMSSRYSVLSSAKVVDIRRVPRRPLGLLLLSKSFITEGQLRTATAEAELRAEDLEDTLLRLGAASEAQIAVAKAAQWGCPVLGQDQPVVDVQAPIPLAVLRACWAVPLHYSATAKRIVIGFLHRIEHSLLNSVEEMTGFRAEACLVTRAQFAEQLARLTAPAGWEEVVSAEEQTPAEMANTTGRFAVDVAARSAQSTRCQELIWTRLAGKRRVLDLIYSARNIRPAMSAALVEPLGGNVGSLG